MDLSDFDVALINLAAAADTLGPLDGELIDAPVLIAWRFAERAGRPCLFGVCVGHPRLPDGWVTTRPLIAIAIDESWARSEGRFYRLGQRDMAATVSPAGLPDSVVDRLQSLVDETPASEIGDLIDIGDDDE